jgi:hypothetical protein
MLIHNTALTMRGKSPNWLLGGLIPTTYILGEEIFKLRKITLVKSWKKHKGEFYGC